MNNTWEHTFSTLRRSDGVIVVHPSWITSSNWEDDMRKWPEVTYGDIFNYFVLSLGVDGATMKNFKSTEAYQYLQSGKVGRVLLHQVNEDLVFLKADVHPSQSASSPHSAWVLLTNLGVVETAGCSCIAGLGKSCSHAASILWKNCRHKNCGESVQNAVSHRLTGIGCTDEQRCWNAGTQRNLAPKRLVDISFAHHRATDQFQQPGERSQCPPLPPTPAFHSHEELKESLSHLKLPVGSLLHKCCNAQPTEEPSQPDSLPHGEHDIPPTCQPCMSFYRSFIELDLTKRTTLEHITKEQSASHIWHDARKIRITASSAKRVPVRASPEKFLQEHLYPRFHGNAATRYGKENELVASQWLEGCGYSISHRGTVVSAEEPWLSASPDGVLNTEELLEIKCPVLGKSFESLEDLLSSKTSDVKMVAGAFQVQPRGPRGYYMQMQLGMFCTGLTKAKLLIWTPSQQVLISAAYDANFLAEVVPRLKAFYFKYMLPHTVTEFQAGRLSLSDRYRKLCES